MCMCVTWVMLWRAGAPRAADAQSAHRRGRDGCADGRCGGHSRGSEGRGWRGGAARERRSGQRRGDNVCAAARQPRGRGRRQGAAAPGALAGRSEGRLPPLPRACCDMSACAAVAAAGTSHPEPQPSKAQRCNEKVTTCDGLGHARRRSTAKRRARARPSPPRACATSGSGTLRMTSAAARRPRRARRCPRCPCAGCCLALHWRLVLAEPMQCALDMLSCELPACSPAVSHPSIYTPSYFPSH